jgi:hypothetical protein
MEAIVDEGGVNSACLKSRQKYCGVYIDLEGGKIDRRHGHCRSRIVYHRRRVLAAKRRKRAAEKHGKTAEAMAALQTQRDKFHGSGLPFDGEIRNLVALQAEWRRLFAEAVKYD